jgi:diguanylate cyclase (GGDEF)-like protein
MAEIAERKVLIPANAPAREAVERALRNDGWQSVAYGDAREAEDVLSKGAAAAAVVVLGPRDLPSRIEVIKVVRRLCPDAFVVGIGDGGGEANADAVLRSGSTPEELAAAVAAGASVREARLAERVLREKLRVLEERERAQAERIQELEDQCLRLRTWARAAEEQAIRDELTDLYNRRQFMRVAENELDRARRDKSSFAIAMLDIDHFKAYNDAYGHIKGDELLARFGLVLLKNTRRMDTVARYGGEEFILLLPETHESGKGDLNPVRLVERLRQAIERDPILNGPNNTIAPITISAGVVRFPADGRTATVSEMIQEVDVRLFRAKHAGRNRICASAQ